MTPKYCQLIDVQGSMIAHGITMEDSSNRRRSERVVLRIPVHLAAVLPGGKRISIEARTFVVNAHGGLLHVGMELAEGQQIRLSNSETEFIASGRVLRLEGSEDGRFSVAFEFESPAPHFWPVSFPPRDWSLVASEV
jgi:PilZ domain-containing protein